MEGTDAKKGRGSFEDAQPGRERIDTVFDKPMEAALRPGVG